MQIGIAPFGLSLSPMISLLFMNRFCLSYGGETAVASYACIAYGLTIVYLLMQGVGDGSQPLMSLHYGEGKTKEVDRVRNMAYGTAWVLALACMLILYVTRYELGVIFGSSDVVMQNDRKRDADISGRTFVLCVFENHHIRILCDRAKPIFLHLCVCRTGTFIDPFVDCAADFETGRCVAEHGAFTDPDCRNRLFASSEREEADCVTA